MGLIEIRQRLEITETRRSGTGSDLKVAGDWKTPSASVFGVQCVDKEFSIAPATTLLLWDVTLDQPAVPLFMYLETDNPVMLEFQVGVGSADSRRHNVSLTVCAGLPLFPPKFYKGWTSATYDGTLVTVERVYARNLDAALTALTRLIICA